MKRRHLVGFSLIEILLAVSLTFLMMTWGVLYLRSGVASADSHSLAMDVAEQLRVARQSAIATQKPIAVVLPSNSGATGLCQSIYIASGLSMAHVSKVVTFAGNHPGTVLFEGYWPVASGSFSRYPKISDHRYGSPQNAFDFPRWFNNPNLAGYPIASDYAFIFQPDGTVVTNGLPFYEDGSNAGAYHIVAAAGATAAVEAPPGASITPPAGAADLTYYKPTSLAQPWVVSLTPGGEISVASGLPGLAPNRVQVFQSTLPVIGPVGTPPIVTAMPVPSPNINIPGQLVVQPTAGNTSGLPPGMNLTLAADQRVTLTANATDTSGRDLYMQWTVVANASNSANTPANGSFAAGSDPQPMSWDAVSQIWTSSFDWACPPTAQHGDQWTFECKIGDGSVSGMVPYLPATQKLMAVKQPHLWVCDISGGGSAAIYRANLDGSGQQLMTTVPSVTSFSVTQDGQAFLAQPAGGGPIALFSGVTGLPIASGILPGTMTPFDYCSISPQGDKVAYTVGNNAGLDISVYIQDLNSANPPKLIYTESGNLPVRGGSIGIPYWSPDQSKIGFNVIPLPGGLSNCNFVVNTTAPYGSQMISSYPPNANWASLCTFWDTLGHCYYETGSAGGGLNQYDSATGLSTPYYTGSWFSTGGAMLLLPRAFLSPDGNKIVFSESSTGAVRFFNTPPAGLPSITAFPPPGPSIIDRRIAVSR